MIKKLYIIIYLFKIFNINSDFSPELTFVKKIDDHLSLPYYTKFSDKFLWISNNPFGSKLSDFGYISKFKYNVKNFDFEFKKKICAKDILGLALCKNNKIYPGIKSYVVITDNNKFLIQANADHEFSVENYHFKNCCKKKFINSYGVNTLEVNEGPVNLKASPYTFIVNGIEYQFIAVAYNSSVALFQYPLNYPNSLNYPYIVNKLEPFVDILADFKGFYPADVEFSPFACSNGNYLIAITNRNSYQASLYSLEIQNPNSIIVAENISIDISDFNQNFASFSNNRYLAIDTLSLSENLYVYYLDQLCNVTALNNGKPYNTGKFPQALSWSPDSKILVVPNYLDNNFSVYKANTVDIKVELKPKYQAQYPLDSSVITAKVTGGVPPYTFYFSDGTVLSQESNICSITVSPSDTTIYNVTVVDSQKNITGFADPVTVQVAKPIILSTTESCDKKVLIIKGIILNLEAFPVIYTTMQLYIDSYKKQKIYVTSDNSGFFTYNLALE